MKKHGKVGCAEQIEKAVISLITVIPVSLLKRLLTTHLCNATPHMSSLPPFVFYRKHPADTFYSL